MINKHKHSLLLGTKNDNQKVCDYKYYKAFREKGPIPIHCSWAQFFLKAN